MASDEERLSQWMIQAQGGDVAAYRSLLNDLSRLAGAFVGKRLIQKGHVEDVAQEILMAVHLARHTYDPAKPFLPWFYAIARYRMIDSMRKLGRVSRHESAVEFLPDVAEAPAPEDASLSEELERTIQALPARQRQIIELTKVSGLSTKETAARMGMSESAVKVTAHRAYKAIRAAVRGNPDENQ